MEYCTAKQNLAMCLLFITKIKIFVSSDEKNYF